MKLIVGLGNPGPAYKNTRHNLGFTVVDSLREDFRGNFKKDAKSGALKAKLNYQEKDFMLCKPLSYMNLSGGTVLKLMRENKLKPQDLLVVCDDVNLELGRIKVKAQGSAGGHKGLASIIQSLSSERFSRLKIGVSAPRGQKDISDYVLSHFSKDEQRLMRDTVEKAKDALLCWLENGIDKTMSKYNRQSEGEG